MVTIVHIESLFCSDKRAPQMLFRFYFSSKTNSFSFQKQINRQGLANWLCPVPCQQHLSFSNERALMLMPRSITNANWQIIDTYISHTNNWKNDSFANTKLKNDGNPKVRFTHSLYFKIKLNPFALHLSPFTYIHKFTT